MPPALPPPPPGPKAPIPQGPTRASWRNQREWMKRHWQPLFDEHKKVMDYMREIAEGRHDTYPDQVQTGQEKIAAVVKELDKLKADMTERFLR